MINTLSAWIDRSRLVYRTEGMPSLLKMVSRYLINNVFYYHQFYLLKRPVRERVQPEISSKIQNFTVKTISSNKQADELVAEGFEDFRSHVLGAVKYLNKGAIALCIFVEREFAWVAWAGITAEAKKVLLPAPCKVDLSDDDVVGEGNYTVPKYRRLGLNEYGGYEFNEFLREKGITTIYNAALVSDISARKRTARRGSECYAKARHMKILWWTFYKETPILSNNQPNGPL